MTGGRVEKVVQVTTENAFQLPHGNPFLIFHGCLAQSQSKHETEAKVRVWGGCAMHMHIL